MTMDVSPDSKSLYLSEKLLYALEFASVAHKQLRKGPNRVPYISHPAAVGLILWKTGYSEDITIAGILHDVIEDTAYTRADIEREFGREIADWVVEVSEDGTLPHDEMKEQYLDNLKTASSQALAISAADLLANRRNMLLELKQGFRLWYKNPPKNMDRDRQRIAIIKAGPAVPFMPEIETVVEEVHRYFINPTEN